MSSEGPQDFDVAIVGLGPTGLTLAHFLGRRGLSVIALEREPEFYGNARAVYTDDECMRIFQEAGVAAELEADMILDAPVQWVLENGSVLGQLRRFDRPYGWTMNNFLYQPYFETKLERMLSRHPNVRIMRGRELVAFEQDNDWVTFKHGASKGVQYGRAAAPAVDASDLTTLRARWLVACDGGRSGVRSQLGIKMVGKSFPEPWLVVDIKARNGADCFRHLPYFNFHCDPKRPTVSCPQPGGHHRFEFLVLAGETREQMEDPANVRALVSQHVDYDKIEVLRRLVYTFNALVAERWQVGRVLLAGDAAHMTPQFMGQGMSSGVRDAHNLAWKLDAVLRGRADPPLIHTYEAERKPHAKEMIDVSVRMKEFVSQPNPVKAALRNALVALLLKMPKLGDYIREARWKPPPTYPNGSYFGLARTRRNGAEGRPIPQPQVRTYAGRRALLDDVIGDNFVLVGYGVDPRATLDGRTIARLELLDARFVVLYPYGGRPQGRDAAPSTPAGLIEVEDLSGEALSWFRKAGARPGHVALVRPDKFVYAMRPAGRIAEAVSHALSSLGAASNPERVPGGRQREPELAA